MTTPIWIVQNNGIERISASVALALRAAGQPWLDVSIHGVDSFEQDVLARLVEEGYCLEQIKQTPLFFYGSTLLVKALKSSELFGRHRIYTDEHYNAQVWKEKRGVQMLNQEVQTMSLGEVKERLKASESPESSLGDQALEVFIRPCSGLKSFTGTVVTLEGFDNWLFEAQMKNPQLSLDELVTVSPFKEIHAEYRVIVVNGAVQDNLVSLYKMKDKGKIRETSEEEMQSRALVVEQAHQLVQGWLPDRMCTMDLALMKNGEVRVVEFNGIHCCGLYGMDRREFIEHISQHL